MNYFGIQFSLFLNIDMLTETFLSLSLFINSYYEKSGFCYDFKPWLLSIRNNRKFHLPCIILSEPSYARASEVSERSESSCILISHKLYNLYQSVGLHIILKYSQISSLARSSSLRQTLTFSHCQMNYFGLSLHSY